MVRFANHVSDTLKAWKTYLTTEFPTHDVFIGPKYVGAIKFPGISLQLNRAAEHPKYHGYVDIFIDVILITQGQDLNMYVEAIEELEGIMEKLEDEFDTTPSRPAENKEMAAGFQPAETGYTEWVSGTVKVMTDC